MNHHSHIIHLTIVINGNDVQIAVGNTGRDVSSSRTQRTSTHSSENYPLGTGNPANAGPPASNTARRITLASARPSPNQENRPPLNGNRSLQGNFGQTILTGWLDTTDPWLPTTPRPIRPRDRTPFPSSWDRQESERQEELWIMETPRGSPYIPRMRQNGGMGTPLTTESSSSTTSGEGSPTPNSFVSWTDTQ